MEFTKSGYYIARHRDTGLVDVVAYDSEIPGPEIMLAGDPDGYKVDDFEALEYIDTAHFEVKV